MLKEEREYFERLNNELIVEIPLDLDDEFEIPT